MTNSELEAFCRGAAPVLKRQIEEGIATAIALLSSRLDLIELRLEQVAEKGIAYKGVWSEGTAYGVGDCCTWNGSMWIAKRATCERPGFEQPGDRAWTLAVKRGRDGRDAR